ncbi:hypothetical protein IJJ54_02815 [Candidatus Saccharibacteria bacterium]|nr:hypothetical protein [Candidatus Saccharibacteria bacterium]
MWFNNIADIATIAQKSGFCIFELPNAQLFADILPKSVRIKRLNRDPATGKSATTIKKSQIQDIFPLVDVRHADEFFVVIEEAEKIGTEAYNCFLKHLEEPRPKVHYVLLTTDLSQIIPTVRSRAHIFRLQTPTKLQSPPDCDAKILALAKEYLSCTPQQLPSFAKKITKDSKTARDKAQQVVSASIDLMYRSYFATGSTKFLHKLRQLLATQEQLTKGNLKLQLVAHML